MHALEEMVPSSVSTTKPDTVMLDMIFLQHTLSNLPKQLRGVTRLILKIVLRQATSSAHLICDVYNTPSIKDLEHASRGDDNCLSFHFGPSQVTPKDF